MQTRYREAAGDHLAASIAFYGFLSLFALVLLALGIAGSVLARDPAARERLVAVLTASVPGAADVAGEMIRGVVDARGVAGVAAVFGLAWSGTGAARAARDAVARIWQRHERRGFVLERLTAVGTVGILGPIAVLAAAAPGAAAALGSTPFHVVAGAAIGIVLDFAMFLVAYRMLIPKPAPPWPILRPGAAVATAGWSVLKLAGGWLAARTAANAGAVFGGLAAATGLLVLLLLASRVFLYGAVLTKTLADRAAGLKRSSDEPLGGAWRS